MSDLRRQIHQRLTDAVVATLGDGHAGIDPALRPSGQLKHGDFQANLAMGLARKRGENPRDLSQRIAGNLDRSGLLADVTIAGPGFINLTIERDALEAHAAAMLADPRVGIEPTAHPQTVVIDYSSPNVAKEMHVGHLRSTVIGDALARTLAAVGHRVIRQNHLGDWGTQFGMLIENMLDQPPAPPTRDEPEGDLMAAELTRLYKAAKTRFDTEAGFADRARQRVVRLQAGDEATLAAWRALVEGSKRYFQSVYERLGVLLEPGDIRGESFYNDRLAGVIQRLEYEGQLHESQGARVVFPEGFSDRDNQPLAMIVQKSDGGYLYATTDLASALYRVDELGARRVIYCVGAPQRQHFEMLFQALRQLRWIDAAVRMDFVGFGSVLGPDRKMFKTRSGETISLLDLIDEAQSRVEAVIAQKNPDLDAAQRRGVAEAVGVGALKYADLSNDRIKDYVFDWDRMLALDGNTAPYLMYSYARIRSIFRRGGVDFETFAGGHVAVNADAERALVLALLEWPGVVASVAQTLEPHRLCNYLYDLAGRYHRFFEHCPVLKAEDDALRDARLALCKLTALVLQRGLALLGIRVVERM